MQSRDRAHLHRMREALDKIELQMEGVDYERFLTDVHVSDAVAMQLVVLGEAANKLSGELQTAHPLIAWRKIIGLRHLIAHEYDRLEPSKLWDIVTGDVVRLSSALPVPPPPGED